MSMGSDDLAEVRRETEEAERIARQLTGSPRGEAFLVLRDELRLPPTTCDQAIQAADRQGHCYLGGVHQVRRALRLVADQPGITGQPGSGRYRLELAGGR